MPAQVGSNLFQDTSIIHDHEDTSQINLPDQSDNVTTFNVVEIEEQKTQMCSGQEQQDLEPEDG